MGDDKKFSYEKELWEGVDKVNARYDEGEKTMREMEKFFDSRASLESDFARKLQATCVKPIGAQEGRTFGAAWQACRQNNENIAKSHAALGQTLTTIANDLTVFRKELGKQKDQHNNTISTLKRELARGSDSVKKAKQSYFQKSEASEVASALYTKSQSDASVNPKTLSKYSASAIKSKKEADQADSAYQQTVQEFQAFQLKYEESMKNVLTEFQRMEEKRLTYLKEILDKVIQSQETLNSELENHQISFKTAVSQINGNADVQNFIAENKTGVAPARPTEYEPFGQPAKAQTAGTTTTKSKKLSKSSARKSVSSALSPLVHSHSTSSSAHSTSSATPSSYTPPVSSTPTPSHSAPTSAPEKEIYAKALYDYQAQDETELSFDVDEVITVTKQDNSGWWEGSIHGKTGIFPANYCQIVDKKPAGTSAPVKQAPVRAPAAQPNVKKCQVKFEFIGESADELSIYEGEIITITETADGWYSGTNERGESGMFPANYVVLL